MISKKCQSCGLTNWATDVSCKRCKARLPASEESEAAEKARIHLEQEKAFGEKWGLEEFVHDGPDAVPVHRWFLVLGVSGCLKLVVMIATLLSVAIYGGGILSDLLPSGFSGRLKAAIGIGVLTAPAIYLALLSAWALDRIFKLIRAPFKKL